MSKLQELINELCPDGVEYKQIKDIAWSGIGLATSVTKYKREEGVVLIHNSDIKQNKIELKNKEFLDETFVKKNAKKTHQLHDIITVHTGDVGTSAVIEKEYVGSIGFTTIITRINNFSEVDPYYLAHYLNSSLFKTEVNKRSISDRNNLNQKDYETILVPVPPLPVQEEIVRILDKMTGYVTELKAELKARKMQYEYYRDDLLAFGNSASKGNLQKLINELCPDGVEYKKIKDVYKRLKGTPITADKMKEIQKKDGDIRIFAGGKTVIDTFEEDIPKGNITRVPAVLIQSRGIIDAIYYDKPFTFKNEMWAYTCENNISVKFLYYLLKSNVEKFRDAASGMGSLPQISLKVTEEFVIPVPPLPVQEEIVRILDKFNLICNDISAGLPAEIEARQKQYEYYRDKLLSFKETSHDAI